MPNAQTQNFLFVSLKILRMAHIMTILKKIKIQNKLKPNPGLFFVHSIIKIEG